MSKKITHEQAREELRNDDYDLRRDFLFDYITQQEEQEKLLELYKELMTVKDDMFDACEIVDDEFYDIRKIETDLEQQIKEIRK